MTVFIQEYQQQDGLNKKIYVRENWFEGSELVIGSCRLAHQYMPFN